MLITMRFKIVKLELLVAGSLKFHGITWQLHACLIHRHLLSEFNDRIMESSSLFADGECLCEKLYDARDGARQHWCLSHHCTNALYPQSMPNLQLPSREARFYWRLYTRRAMQGPLYEVNLSHALLRSLRRDSAMKVKNIYLPPELIKIKRLDWLQRKQVIGEIKNYVTNQRHLQTLCMEGLELKRMEGVDLVLALKNSRKTLKYLYCWRTFERTEGPLLVDTGNFNGTGVYKDRVIRESEWLKAMGCLQTLTTLALNYAYIANAEGDFLIKLSEKIGQQWRWLQLLCVEDEIPVISNPNDGVGGHKIPDVAWKNAIIFAPELKVQFVFVDVHGYDNQRRFLSKSIPVHTMMISTSVRMSRENPSLIDCTIKTLWFWYPQTLVHLALQLFHHPESLDSLLIKILINLPRLEILEFTGELKTIKTLHVICTQITSQTIKLKHINLHLQKPIHTLINEEEWKGTILNLLSTFQQHFHKLGINFIINFYPM